VNCTEVEARLVDVVDGRLDPVATVRLHAHIEGCPACRTRAAFWRAAVPKMRALAPAGPEAMSIRRMQVEIERLVGAEAASPAPRASWRWPRLFVPATLTLVGAAAVLLALRAPSKPLAPGPAAETGYATLTRVTGALTIGGRAQAAAARLPADREIVLAAATEAELSLDRGSTLRIDGPARLRLGGTARAVEVRLDAGTLAAAVAHRVAGETFAVATPDLRVEVRGTKFAVVATPIGSSVRVSEGRVAVRFSDGSERPVAAGESAAWPVPAAPPPAAALPVPGTAAAEPRPACGAVVRACEEAGRAARRSMRSGDAAHALRLIAAGGHDARTPDATCASSLTACEDELRYLRAEAFRQQGELDDAVAAYHQLDRHGAPAAMRQNALYAAAQIEQRQGHKVRAHSDYEKALGAAPEGALREEALVGSMESAAALGDTARARQLARRYLATFPSGLRVATARRLAGTGAQP
jgi:tetratricopeptide (TPR) repeat protein